MPLISVHWTTLNVNRLKEPAQSAEHHRISPRPLSAILRNNSLIMLQSVRAYKQRRVGDVVEPGGA
jgi:hypothetical protein